MKFRYVKGGIKDEDGNFKKIEDTVYYKLLEKTSEGSYHELARQEMVTGIMIMDKGQGILGPIGDNGKPFEKSESLLGDGATNSGPFVPLAELTDNGYVYYLRFQGYMRPFSRGSYLTPKEFSGRLYLASQEPIETISHDYEMTVKSDGIYLNTSLGEVNVYKREISELDDKSVTVTGTVTVYSAAGQYHRTDYIPLDVLTNGLANGYCLGVITGDYNTYGKALYTLAFYDENLSFLCGVTRAEIYAEYERNPCYLTKEEIETLIKSKLGESGYTTAKYLIFSTYNADDEGETMDLVSTEIIYFPLNKYDVDSILARNGKFVVQAIGDGFFVEDSEYSNEEPKTVG